VVHRDQTVTQRDRLVWTRLLIGVLVGLVVVDVLVLTDVLPLLPAEATPAITPVLSIRLTQTAVVQSLILPTRDPNRPWPSRTPTPTATPWTVLLAMREPRPNVVQQPAQAEEIPSRSSPTQAMRGTVSPTEASAAADMAQAAGPSTPAIKATATRKPSATPASITARAPGVPTTNMQRPNPAPPTAVVPPPGAVPTQELPVSSTIAPTDVATPTPDDVPTKEPPATATIAPTHVATPTLVPATSQPPPPIAAGDAAQFQAYVQTHYDTILGQKLGIEAVSFSAAGPRTPGVTVQLLGNDKDNVFAAQTAATALDFGRRLLNDTKFYYHEQPCVVTVISRYETTDATSCTHDPSWCYVRGYNQARKSWSIVRTYVRGTYIGESTEVQVWNGSS
jgi:hypothetical protein